jgi:hypothetical protein
MWIIVILAMADATLAITDIMVVNSLRKLNQLSHCKKGTSANSKIGGGTFHLNE